MAGASEADPSVLTGSATCDSPFTSCGVRFEAVPLAGPWAVTVTCDGVEAPAELSVTTNGPDAVVAEGSAEVVSAETTITLGFTVELVRNPGG